MRHLWPRACALVGTLAISFSAFAADKPATSVEGFTYPESVCYGFDGNLYVTEIGKPGTKGDGGVSVIKDGKREAFATGLDDPKGICFYRDALYLTDVTKIVKVDKSGKTSVYKEGADFPVAPLYLNDIAVDAGNGLFLFSDSGIDGKGAAAYRIDVRLNKIDQLASSETIPGLTKANGIAFDGGSSILLADMPSGTIYRVRLHDKAVEKVAEGMPGADGIVWDHFGRLFVSSWSEGKIWGIPRPGVAPILIGEGLQSAADGCLAASGDALLVPDMKSGTITKLSTTIPGWEVDTSPLNVHVEVAFPSVKWDQWDDGSESGVVVPFRPIFLTHAGDGSKRTFVGEQHGKIHVIDSRDDAAASKVFLDIEKKVRYADKQNEEGLLGIAFHPKHKENGEFFVFYTDVGAKMENVISRFRVKKDDPNVADPASEEEILRIERPFWNHDGGTLAFGPDGYLYVALGDGGSGGDPMENGQNKNTLLGKILRIDIDRKADGKNYAIPSDNPFVGQENSRGEIWAYGIRNIWRMAFDSKTGKLWAGEVGQNLFEEIFIVSKGGNFGWNVREALHPFGNKGVGQREDLIDPIWEYHHDLGKSITGGGVYRGKAVPELDGYYVYVDYVTNKMWALKYDETKGRVVENRPITIPVINALSFGEDDHGELFVMGASPTGRGIYRFKSGAAK